MKSVSFIKPMTPQHYVAAACLALFGAKASAAEPAAQAADQGRQQQQAIEEKRQAEEQQAAAPAIYFEDSTPGSAWQKKVEADARKAKPAPTKIAPPVQGRDKVDFSTLKRPQVVTTPMPAPAPRSEAATKAAPAGK